MPTPNPLPLFILLNACWLLLPLIGIAQLKPAMPLIDTFHLDQIRLLESPFKHAESKGRAYILSLDPDRLLAPYLREAGLEPKAQPYGNWESSGLDGHIGGHLLTALSLLHASTGDEEALKRLNYMLDELQAVQLANGDGYIGGVPGSRKLWKQVAKGSIDADLFSLNGSWVPWYNIHKVYAGLRDAWTYAGSEQARDMLIEFSDWAIELVADLSDQEIQTMLETEYGGMNEVFADVAEITGDEKHLTLARQFSHERILNPLLEERDELTGLHANTQIPKVIGFKRVADASGDKAWDKASDFFWSTVVENRTVAIGGNSVREHFHDCCDFHSMVTDPEGPETCNTYNMLKLSKMLYQSSGDMRYLDYYERALYNHILSSQHPEHGGLVYFTSMRPSHYRKYSDSQQAMWCCVGSGIENHVKYGELIYGHSADSIFIHLFIPSELQALEHGIALRQETQFPEDAEIRIEMLAASKRSLKVRWPVWAACSKVTVRINDEAHEVKAEADGYLKIPGPWQAGDTVSLELPLQIHLEQMPDESDYFAILYGPIVLAAATNPFPDEDRQFVADDSRMGHIANGERVPLGAAPFVVSDTRAFADQIQRIEGQGLRFQAPGLINDPHSKDLLLKPFHELHDSRYVVYWPYADADGLESIRDRYRESERERLALERRTIDQVSPGEQQPESDHSFQGERTRTGVNRGRHWRHAEGWFSYDLNNPYREGSTLRITYFGLDRDRHFRILINDNKIAQVELQEKGDRFYDVDYPVPDEIVDNAPDGILTVKFVAEPDSTAGGIYGVRLLRSNNE
ncbi:MAG: glycoside hydrolase family 127 protein [Opitutales bacterium]|nr:glycoside hydrolase family 127 protein [Opitutales bacterium]